MNVRQPEAWAYRAVMAHLRNEPAKETQCRNDALRHYTNNPAVDHLIGRKLSRLERTLDQLEAEQPGADAKDA